jgi:hypothetical protein
VTAVVIQPIEANSAHGSQRKPELIGVGRLMCGQTLYDAGNETFGCSRFRCRVGSEKAAKVLADVSTRMLDRASGSSRSIRRMWNKKRTMKVGQTGRPFQRSDRAGHVA